MKNRVLLASTGTIVGRINGFNVHLVTEILPPLIEEGLIAGGELMMLNAYYDRMEAVAKEWREAGIPFPVIHCEKDVGAFLSDAGALSDAGDRDGADKICRQALDLFEKNCEMAALAGSERMVFHLWGGMNSDDYFGYNEGVLPLLLGKVREYGIRLLIENVPAAWEDPLTNLWYLAWHNSSCPDMGFVYDTRFGHLHRQMEDTFEDPRVAPLIEHIHISDHRGAHRDFSSLRPILHPGEGDVDFDAFARLLDGIGYEGTVTLESPVIRENGADGEKLKRTLSHLHTFLV